MTTGNPLLDIKNFRAATKTYSQGSSLMSVQGVIHKTTILLFCVALTAIWTWQQSFARGGNPALAMMSIQIGGISGLVLSVVTCFKKEWSSITAPLYALAEGCVLGGVSGFLERSYPGIAFQAILLTLTTLFSMLLLYRMGIIRVTKKFQMIVATATGGVFFFYFFSMLFSFFGATPLFVGNGVLSIGFSLFVVGIAALNLVQDFHNIELGEQYGLPQYMEWYSAFGLLVTLVWLYIELIRLLSKLRSKD